MRGGGLLLGALFALAGSSIAAEPPIRNFHHAPAVFDPVKGERVAIRFKLEREASVRVHVYDGRNRLVRTLDTGSPLEPGEHVLEWDGHDQSGRAVVPEAYVYVFETIDIGGSRSLLDLSDGTGGETLRLHKLHWDPATQTVRYALPQAARVRVRLGLGSGGPMVRTLLDWVPRAKGTHAEPWDGLDASGVLRVADDPRLEVAGQGFALPRNTIVVGPPSSRVELIDELPDWGRREAAERPSRYRLFDYARQPIDQRREYQARIELPAGLPRSAEGDPIITGPTPIRLTVDPSDLGRVVEERCEAVFYLDGEFIFENEVAFLPITWNWDPGSTAPGLHYLSANVRSYEGYFGTLTLRVVVPEREAGTRPGQRSPKR